MTLFESIVSDLLITERVEAGNINKAIDGLHPASIRYNSGGQNKATGYRLIYPIAYGLSKTGNPVVRAFETGGDTASENPGWKFFRTDRILSWKTLPRTFNPNSMEFGGQFSLMNKDGDESMSQVFNISPIGNAAKVKSQMAKSGKIGTGPITKDDVDNAGIVPSTQTADMSGTSPRSEVDRILTGISGNKGPESVDKAGEKPYNVEKDLINAPETEPVRKSDIEQEPVQEPEIGNESETMPNEPSDKPITKDDVENGGESENNELADKYWDMLNRMDKVGKEED